MGKKIERINPRAFSLLEKYDYPGNVRELENMIERAVVLSQKSELEMQDFLLNVTDNTGTHAMQNPVFPATYREAKQTILENFERKFFMDALKSARGNISKAAEQIGMHRKNFY